MSRLKILEPADLTPAQRPLYDHIVNGRRGGLIGPFNAWLRSPALAERAEKLGYYARYDSVLPPRLSELAILVIAAHWKAEYEWYAHEPDARKGGLAENIIQSIKKGERPSFEKADEEAVYDVALMLTVNHHVTDEAYQAALSALGEQALVDLIGVMGYYTFVALTLNCFRVPLPPGEKSPFAG